MFFKYKRCNLSDMKYTKAWGRDDYITVQYPTLEEWNAMPTDPLVKEVYIDFSSKDLTSFVGLDTKFPNAETVTLNGTFLEDIKGFPFDPSKVKKLKLRGSLKAGHSVLHFPKGMNNLEALEIDDAVTKIVNFPKSVKKLKLVGNTALKSLPRVLPNLERLTKRGVGSVNNLGVWDASKDPNQARIKEEILEGNDAKYFPKAPKLEYLGIDDEGFGGSQIYDFSAIDYPNIKKARIGIWRTDPDYPNLNLYDIEDLNMSFPSDTRDLSNLPNMPSLLKFHSWHAKSVVGLDERAPNIKELILSRDVENGVGIPESVEKLRMETNDLTSLKGVPRKHFIQLVDDVLSGDSNIEGGLRRALWSCSNQLDLKPDWKDRIGDYALRKYGISELEEAHLCEKAYYKHNITTEEEALASARSIGLPESQKRFALDYLRENHLCTAWPKLEGLSDRRLQRKLSSMGRLYEQKCGHPYG